MIPHNCWHLLANTRTGELCKTLICNSENAYHQCWNNHCSLGEKLIYSNYIKLIMTLWPKINSIDLQSFDVKSVKYVREFYKGINFRTWVLIACLRNRQIFVMPCKMHPKRDYSRGIDPTDFLVDYEWCCSLTNPDCLVSACR